MIRLPKTVKAWRTQAFKAVFEQEARTLEPQLLPLEQGMSQGSRVAAAEIGVMLLDTAEVESSIRVKAGIFFSSVVAGCNCADDPTPPNENSEYCEVQFDIDKRNGVARVTLLDV